MEQTSHRKHDNEKVPVVGDNSNCGTVDWTEEPGGFVKQRECGIDRHNGSMVLYQALFSLRQQWYSYTK